MILPHSRSSWRRLLQRGNPPKEQDMVIPGAWLALLAPVL
jgi:hypothetical protein